MHFRKANGSHAAVSTLVVDEYGEQYANTSNVGTLQELLAPRAVEFWSRDGKFLGNKETLKDLVHDITGIPLSALLGVPLSEFSAPERLRWATKRATRREEDKAYCLFGIFDVSLPVLYGEGGRKAHDRLETEIKRLQDPARQMIASAGALKTSDLDPQARREAVLASLAFEQIDSRRSNIKTAQSKTCEWLFQHPDYLAWNGKESRRAQDKILWIAGKPGAGKSTLMKVLLAHTKKAKGMDEIILDFFFNARGDEPEKTTLGMYRALLLKLLKQAPDLQCVLDNIDGQNFGEFQASTWTAETLQPVFHDAIENLGSRKLKIFIDALDECNEI